MMKLKSPISVITFPYPYDEDEQDNRFTPALDAYSAFMRSRLKSDAASYCNASTYVAGTLEKESLISLCNDKMADIEALDANRIKPASSSDGEIDFEAQSYTQYILDVDFELLLDITAVFHFAYKREFKTLETFERLQKATEHRGSQALIGEGIRLQRASILRLDAKLSRVQSNDFPAQEHSFSNSYPVLVR